MIKVVAAVFASIAAFGLLQSTVIAAYALIYNVKEVIRNGMRKLSQNK